MRYIVIVNDEDILGNGGEMNLEDATYEIGELLRERMFEVESVKELNE